MTVALAKTAELAPAERDRGRAACPLFGRCGGCSTLHMDEAAYSVFKTGRLGDALAARGLAPPLAPMRGAPLASRRRATFTAVAGAGGVTVGYQAARSHEVVDVAACPALAPDLGAALPAIRALATGAAATSGRARVTATLCENGVDVAITTEKSAAKKPKRGKRRDKRAPPPPLATDDPRIVRLTVDGDLAFARETPIVRFDGVAIPFPPAAFLQASLEGEAHLIALVSEGASGAETLFDGFCGLGTFTAPLTRFAKVTAADVDGPALAALETGLAHASGRRGATVVRRNLMQDPLSLPELARFDTVVFDPPRAGAEAFARSLAASTVKRIVAVSCDPGTFARDCAILAESGYAIEAVTPVDQFVGTAHIEAVAVLRRE
ncbi:RNA methyltransferase [Acuticoccus sp. M5D2P5]|uniref:class I SAM-dependent RNA methyltransferase n=1 Tax=Acuticoccus kalidii TaxID=2910977 RepID=UPI001F247BFD|nr:RNA methyltransferase [Acuticoccus kalidii]MCF3934212.1 RNA methyltransferase [Acuticoccus kalidii]